MSEDAPTPEEIAAKKAAEKRRKEVEIALSTAMLFLRGNITVIFWWHPDTWSEFEDMLASAIDPATNAGDEAAKAVWLGYDSLDPQTVDAQRAYRDKFAQQTADATKRSVEQTVAWLSANGISGEDADAILAQIAGTNANQAGGFLAKLTALIEAGATTSAVLDTLKTMVSGALKDRIKVLAGDALWTAVEMGQVQAGRQEQRATNAYLIKIWRTAMDERVCDTCGPLHGKEVGINDPFDGGVMMPPAHSGCRCHIHVTQHDNRDG